MHVKLSHNLWGSYCVPFEVLKISISLLIETNTKTGLLFFGYETVPDIADQNDTYGDVDYSCWDLDYQYQDLAYPCRDLDYLYREQDNPYQDLAYPRRDLDYPYWDLVYLYREQDYPYWDLD